MDNAPTIPKTQAAKLEWDWKELADSAWLWGAIGLVAGASVSVAPVQSLPWIFFASWLALLVAGVRHLPPKKPIVARGIVNVVVSVLIATGLYSLDGRIMCSLPPPPKDPPTAEENARAFVALMDQRKAKETSTGTAPAGGQSAGTPKVLDKHKTTTPTKSPEHPSGLVDSPSAPIQQPLPQAADLIVTQEQDISTDKDNPVKTNVIVQTTEEFPSLNLALECDGPIDHGHGGFNGVMMMVREGVMSGHPNVFVLTYQSASPQFGPGNPLHITLWSKDAIRCSKASTF